MSSSISPLFAVHAEQFYSAGMYAETLDLCLRGIELYPHYPTAYVLTARSMWALGHSAEAQEFIVNAISHFPVHPALLRLEQEFFGLHPVSSAPPTERTRAQTELDNHDFSHQDDNVILENDDVLLDKEIFLPEHEIHIPAVEESLPEGEVRQKVIEDIQHRIEGILPNTEDVHQEIEDSQPEIEHSHPEIHKIQPNENTTEHVQLDSDDDALVDKHVEKYTPLRIIEMTKVSHSLLPMLKASSINLIPGLDFTPLKFQNGHTVPKNGILPAQPSFPRFRERHTRIDVPKSEPEESLHSTEPVVIEASSETPSEELHKLTQLEELAARLEKVRIPAMYEEITRSHSSELVPAMITETMARIYEKQGAFPEAIKAYQILARRTPEKLDFYEERIREVQGRMMGDEG